MDKEIILKTVGISKSFGSVKANKNINFFLKKGEILSILGENGAGKSTLMNILYGLHKPDEGEIFINDKKVEFNSSKDSIENGLGMVHQHFKLVENLSVTQNIILGQEPIKHFAIDYKKSTAKVKDLSKKYKLEINPNSLIKDLPIGIQQRVEILKVLYRNANILILDEPTAVLTPQEVMSFFKVVENLRDNGVSVIIITHKLKEIQYLSDRVYILRKGEITDVFNTSDVSAQQLASSMVGRNVVLTSEYKKATPLDFDILKINNIKVKNNQNLLAINNLSLNVKPGEIVGIAGVEGNGQSELAHAIMGLTNVFEGEIIHKDEDITSISVKKRIARGMGYVPDDRQKAGLIMPFPITENILVGNHYNPSYVSKGIIQKEFLINKSEALIKDFCIKSDNCLSQINELSGGNQQKVILAREFDRDPNFLLVSQPTRGLDVGAIEYIHSCLVEMKNKKVGILLISMELDEILSLADRILVMFDGQIIKEFTHEEATDKKIGYYMTGGAKND